MGVGAAVFAVLVVAFVALSGRLSRAYVSAPIAFVAAGALIGPGVFDIASQREAIRLLAEVTLVLMLFHDAAQVQPRHLRAESSLEGRLLLIGLPLTIAAGWFVSRALFPGIGGWFALLLAAALAPTDAGLGAPTVLNPVVPVRARRILNAESGLNDGLATPVVLFAIAAIAGEEHIRPAFSMIAALGEIGIGVVVGVAVGVLGAKTLDGARTRGWAHEDLVPIAVLMLPLLAYSSSGVAHGNGFIAAFVSGTSFSSAISRTTDVPASLHLTEVQAELLGYGVWALFGAAFLPALFGDIDWRIALFALLSLTVLRMGPVWLALLGSGLRIQTVAFIGWFGPRGLASVIFALLAYEELADDAAMQTVLATVGLTVLLSVVAHGLSAEPLAQRFGAWVARVHPPIDTAPAPEPTGVRGRVIASRHEESTPPSH